MVVGGTCRTKISGFLPRTVTIRRISLAVEPPQPELPPPSRPVTTESHFQPAYLSPVWRRWV
jgi:hypothetical protein